jgi:hypothetical protein
MNNVQNYNSYISIQGAEMFYALQRTDLLWGPFTCRVMRSKREITA